MREEHTRKITCDECGYSEIILNSRLPYEEGKTCPRCRKGKMYWVPAAEEARRREFQEIYGQGRRVMAEERRVSPLWIIPISLALGVGAGLGLLLAVARREEEVPPVVLANLYGRVTDDATGEPVADVLGTLNGLEFYTDAGGNYAFTDLEPGSYTISFGKEGYEPVVGDIILVEGNNELNVQLTPIAAPVSEFYMPATMQVSESGPVDGLYTVNFSLRITNKGNASGRYQLTWGSNELGPQYEEEASRIIEIEPGKSYDWSWSWPEIPHYYRGYFTVWLFGDWEADNSSVGVWQ